MIGTLTNVACILTGTMIGCILRKGIKQKYVDALYNAMGLSAMALGASTFARNIGQSEYPVLFIASIAIGGLVGAMADLQGRVDRFAARKGVSRLAEGLTAASLLFCIGTFSIVGPILAALRGDNTFLFTNATLDLVTSAVFATTYGWGIILAAPILLLWQGSIYALARYTAGAELMQGPLLNELSIVGGLLIISSSLAILKIKDCKTLNYLPSLMVPVLFYIIKGVVG